jgi:transcriptional regulator of arginine metabolism
MTSTLRDPETSDSPSIPAPQVERGNRINELHKHVINGIFMLMISKHRRQQTIVQIVRGQGVSTQTGLVNELNDQGIIVNQSTVSRDIKELGLVKAPHATGGYCYSIQTDIVAMTERSLRILRDFVNSVDGSGHLAVVHTDSGNAHPVAEALDRLDLDDVVGTIAGENTLLVILREPTNWQQFRENLEEWL